MFAVKNASFVKKNHLILLPREIYLILKYSSHCSIGIPEYHPREHYDSVYLFTTTVPFELLVFVFLFLFIDAQFHRIWTRLYNYKHYNEINWVFIRIFSLFSKTIFVHFFSWISEYHLVLQKKINKLDSIRNSFQVPIMLKGLALMKRMHSLGTKFVHLLKCFSNHDAVGGVFFSQNPESIGFEAMIRISLLKAQIIYHCYVNAAWCLLNIFFVIWFQMVHKMSRRQIE